MFEINITKQPGSKFSADPEKWHGYDPVIHRTFKYHSPGIYMNGLGFKNETDDVCENERFLVIRCGQVFHSLKHTDKLSPLTATDINHLFLQKNVSFLDEIKGNFIIFLLSKTDNTLIVAKDKLGLKYLYYKTDQNGYFISTNLNDFKRLDHVIDDTSVLQHLIFTYPIGNTSFIKGVKFLEMGSFLSVEKNSVTLKRYFSVDDLFTAGHKITKFEKDHFADLFKKSVVQRSNTTESPNVSLTGGFDGRAVSAVLVSEEQKFQAYSFGMKGGENTAVPLNISRRTGLNYEPVFLNDVYEKQYFSCGSDAVYFSDGVSKFERANYVFATRNLAAKSHVNITGLIGGEVFGTVHLKTDYINESYFDSIYCFRDIDLKKELDERGIRNFLSSDFFDRHSTTDFYQSIESRRKEIKQWQADDLPWLYYLKDLISLGFQRFYGNQMHLERYYCDNLTPFYDIDILAYLFSTSHINIYKNAFKSSPFLRIKNRKLQSIIIKKFSHALGELPVDRGYPPNYNLDFRKVLIPYYFYKRKKNINRQKSDFDSPYWCRLFYKDLVKDPSLYQSNLITVEKLDEFLKGYTPEKYCPELNQVISLSIWLAHV